MGEDELSVQSHQNACERLELELDRIILEQTCDELNTLPELRTIDKNLYNKLIKINNFFKRLVEKKEQGKKVLRFVKKGMKFVKKLFKL